MTLDLDTFLVALYTFTDDLYRQYGAPHKPSRPGPSPQLSDSEVLTLAICAQWYHGSERAFLRYAVRHWRPYFPHLLSQSAFNRRVRDLVGVLLHLVPEVAKALGAYAGAYQVFDTIPVPLLRRCRGQHHRLFADEAAIGRVAATMTSTMAASCWWRLAQKERSPALCWPRPIPKTIGSLRPSSAGGTTPGPGPLPQRIYPKPTGGMLRMWALRAGYGLGTG
jgi:hypothetical protein